MFHYAAAHDYDVCTKDEFVTEIFYGMAYALGARIIGFNVTFDICRIADPVPSPAKGRMRGGFSLKLRPEKYMPRVRFRQIDRRMAFVDFAGRRGAERFESWRRRRRISTKDAWGLNNCRI